MKQKQSTNSIIELYGILDPTRSLGRPLDKLAYEAAENGVTLLQYRDKEANTKTFVNTAKAIKTTLKGTNVPLLINDRIDVALAAKADGVHIGQNDMSVEDARAILGKDAIIGLTIKSSDNIEAANFSLLDYICIGGVYETSSKINTDPALGEAGFIKLLKQAKEKDPHMPTGAIAGITPDRAQTLMTSGSNGVALISALFMQQDVANACSAFKHQIQSGLEARS